MPPLPRVKHTLNFYGPKRILTVYGGIDDSRNINGNPAFYTDLGIFDLINFIWLTVIVYGKN